MAARIDWARWTWPLALALVALPVGLLAGYSPELAILLAFGLVFLLIVFADLANGVVLFTLITFFETIPGASVSLTKVAGALLALAWLATLATRADPRADFLRQHPLITAILVSLLAWAGLSATWSEQPAAAVDAVFRLSLNAILFLVVFTAIRTPRDATRVFAAFVIGATAAALVAVLLTGTGPVAFGQTARISGESENANELASTLVASLALALGLLFAARRSPVLRIAAAAAAAIAMTGIVLTVSRSGLVALGIAAIAAIVFAGPWRPRVIVISVGVALSAVLYFATIAPDTARERITELKGGTGREDIWTVAWRMFEAHPERGVGAGNFSTSSIHYLLEPGALTRSDFIVDTQKVAHNVYLETLAELGVVGLALLAALIVSILACAFKAIREFQRNGKIQMEILARANLVALCGLLAALFFSSDQYKKQLWLLLAMAPTLLAIARADRTAESDADGE
jgi:O-antigen ligase